MLNEEKLEKVLEGIKELPRELILEIRYWHKIYYLRRIKVEYITFKLNLEIKLFNRALTDYNDMNENDRRILSLKIARRVNIKPENITEIAKGVILKLNKKISESKSNRIFHEIANLEKLEKWCKVKSIKIPSSNEKPLSEEKLERIKRSYKFISDKRISLYPERQKMYEEQYGDNIEKLMERQKYLLILNS